LPVTARLSQQFYERFGDDIAGEFVDWFNAVDTTYQQRLRELNDMNWERFKAELHAVIAQAEGRWAERLAQTETRLSEKFSDKLSDTRSELTTMKADLMKWMFIYWCGLAVPLIGLILFRK
jgi:hypothetical protein